MKITIASAGWEVFQKWPKGRNFAWFWACAKFSRKLDSSRPCECFGSRQKSGWSPTFQWSFRHKIGLPRSGDFMVIWWNIHEYQSNMNGTLMEYWIIPSGNQTRLAWKSTVSRPFSPKKTSVYKGCPSSRAMFDYQGGNHVHSFTSKILVNS